MGILVATPYIRMFTGDFVDSLLYSVPPDAPFEWRRIFHKPVDQARNEFVEYFLKNKQFNYLLFADNDAIWHPEAIIRLYERDLPVVCGTMYTRQLPPKPTIGDFLGKSKDGKLVYRFDISCKQVAEMIDHHNLGEDVPNAALLPPTDMDIVEKDGCGMHFTMIRRDVLETIEKPWFFMNNEVGAGEDFHFCQQVKKAGFKIYWDRSVHTGHSIGEGADIGLREFLVFNALAGDNYVLDNKDWEFE